MGVFHLILESLDHFVGGFAEVGAWPLKFGPRHHAQSFTLMPGNNSAAFNEQVIVVVNADKVQTIVASLRRYVIGLVGCGFG